MALRMQRPMARVADTSIARVAPKVAASIYQTAEYAAWRAAVIKRANGRCQDPGCKKPDRRANRLFADHVRELKDGGAPFDVTNGLARCGSCHTRKTNEARADRQRDLRPRRNAQQYTKTVEISGIGCPGRGGQISGT